MSLSVIIISLVFYLIIFKYHGFSGFIVPIFLGLIPGLIFIFGAGLLAGSVQVNILYALMLIVLLIGFLPLPVFFDLYGGKFYSAYPLTLPVGLSGEPPFTLPITFILGKAFYSVLGILMAFFGLRRYAKI